jgi:ankyrin repeat protein
MTVNLASISSEILNDKANDNREVYIDNDISLIILAAIGGDKDIFAYLVENGCSVGTINHITLSKKNRNSVVSNVLGAAAFYGRVDLVSYILEKYKGVDVNFKATEKKSKIKINLQNKEFTDYTPLHLAVASDAPEDYSIHILKLLNKHGANFEATDCMLNNVLHLAVKFNKLAIVKFLVEKLNLYNESLNKEGLSALGLASELGLTHIIDYLQSYSIKDSNINDLLNELEAGKKKKPQQKKKKKDTKEEGLLGSTEYEETFKIKPKQPKVEIKKEPEVVVVREESKEQEYDEDEENNYEEGDNGDNAKKPYERKSYYKDNYYDVSGSNYTRGKRGGGYANNYRGNSYGDYYYNDYNKGDNTNANYYDNTGQNNNYRNSYKRNKYYQDDQTQQYSGSYNKSKYVETNVQPVNATNVTSQEEVPAITKPAVQQQSENTLSSTSNLKPVKHEIVGLSAKGKQKKVKINEEPVIKTKAEVKPELKETEPQIVESQQNIMPEEIDVTQSQKAIEAANELKRIISNDSFRNHTEDEGDEHFLTEEDIGAKAYKTTEPVVEEVSEEVSEEIKPSSELTDRANVIVNNDSELVHKQLNEIMVNFC